MSVGSARVSCRFAAGELAADVAGLAGSGYRVVTNTGPDSGREVARLHRHAIGGRRLGGMA